MPIAIHVAANGRVGESENHLDRWEKVPRRAGKSTPMKSLSRAASDYGRRSFSIALKTAIKPTTSLSFRSMRPYSEGEPIIRRTNGDPIVKHSLKTAALSFGIAVLFGSVAVGFAQTTDTTSSTSQTSTSAPAPAVAYAAPVMIAPAPPVVVAAPVVVAPPSTTTSEHHASSSSDSSPNGNSSEHSSSTSTSNY